MIEVHDTIVPEGEISTLGDVQISVIRNIGDHPADVRIQKRGRILDLEGFLDKIFDVESDGLVPTCETIQWRKVHLIVGIRKVVSTLVGEEGLMSCDLFRSPDEDRGFYSTQWEEMGGLLICIYESGVIVFDSTGSILWHRHKHWDDVFIGVDELSLKLLSAEGATLALELETGNELS